MGVFWINTPSIGANGKNYGLPFECNADTIEDLADLLATKGIVAGNQLRTVDDGRGGKLVQSRKPIALTPRGIAMIMPYDFRVWEAEVDRLGVRQFQVNDC